MKTSTKDILLNKGMELFMEKGFNHTGIQEVLKSVGVPKGSFYHYFKSKGEFGREVVEHYTQQHWQETVAHFDDEDMAPVERIRLFFENQRQHFLENGFSGGCLLGNLSQEMGDQCSMFEELLEKKWCDMSGIIAQCIQEAQEAGQLKTAMQPKALADFIINSWQGAMMRMKVARNSKPLDYFMATVFSSILA